MESFNGMYREWSGAEEQAVSLILLEDHLQVGLIGTPTRFQWALKDLQLSRSADPSFTEIRIQSSPAQIRVEGSFVAERIRLRMDRARLPWLKRPLVREWIRNGGLLIGLVALILIVYSLIVPFLAEKLAQTVSVETEQVLGDGVYDALSTNFRIDSAATRNVNDFFDKMKVPSAYSIRISVVASSELNAFALPGGRIVVYSALLEKMETSSELAALLAHEFTHVDRRHTTRSIFRALGSQVFLGLVLGKVGTVSGVLVDHADQLRSLTYSRSLEKEADLKGLAILTDRGIDPEGFKDLFERLRSADTGSVPEFLASHPDLQVRMSYIKETSKNATVRPQPVLDAIFAEIKK